MSVRTAAAVASPRRTGAANRRPNRIRISIESTLDPDGPRRERQQDTGFSAREHGNRTCRILIVVLRPKALPIVLLAALAAAGSVLAAPRIEPEVSEVDVGDLVRGRSAEALFGLRNTGDETLVILGADPG
jgi:hypothetical protein